MCLVHLRGAPAVRGERRFDVGCLRRGIVLEDGDRVAGAAEHQRGRQATDACAGDEHALG
jgi:hypothetical protein